MSRAFHDLAEDLPHHGRFVYLTAIDRGFGWTQIIRDTDRELAKLNLVLQEGIYGDIHEHD